MSDAFPARAQTDAKPSRSLAIAAVLGAMAAVVIDTGISNVALPTIAASLQVSASDAVLVITAYQTALVMALLPCAALAERFGMTPGAFNSFAFRVRRRLQELVRAEILQTVNSQEDLEDEVAAMLRAMQTE